MDIIVRIWDAFAIEKLFECVINVRRIGESQVSDCATIKVGCWWEMGKQQAIARCAAEAKILKRGGNY